MEIKELLELSDGQKLYERRLDGWLLALRDAIKSGDCDDAGQIVRELHKMCCGKSSH